MVEIERIITLSKPYNEKRRDDFFNLFFETMIKDEKGLGEGLHKFLAEKRTSKRSRRSKFKPAPIVPEDSNINEASIGNGVTAADN